MKLLLTPKIKNTSRRATRNASRAALATLLMLIACAASAFANPKVELRVEPTTRNGVITVGSKFYINIVVSNANGEPSAPSNVPGAKVQYFAHQSSQSSITSVNGHTTQSVINVYAITLKAVKEGSFKFGPITIGGVKSNVVSYTIHDAASAPDPYAGGSGGNSGGSASNSSQAAPGADPGQQGPTFIGKGNDQLFLRANVSKTTAYEQEALVYTVKLYTTYSSIKFIGATDAPKFDGFVIEESNNVSNQLTYETYQGRQYATAIIARYIIFPQMSGTLKVIGNKYTVSTDAEEYYDDPYYMRLTVRRPIQLNVTPNDLTINVKALPSPRPANFSGGVGKFNISSSLKSSNAVANQAASIEYTVTGVGNLKYVHLPDLNALYPDEIEVFSPKTDVKAVVGSDNVSGSVVFDYSMMPVEQGEFKIPAVELVYFNPETGKYETSTSRSYTLNVARGNDDSKSQVALSYDSTLMPTSLTKARAERPYVKGFPYWLWYIVPVCLLIGVLIARRRYINMQADVVGLRSRRAGRMARRRLRVAMACIKADNEEQFYDEMLRATWGYLADKLKLPTSELNRENVSQILADHYIGEEKIKHLIVLLDECEFAKYSPASSRRKMTEVYEDGASLLNDLEEDFAKAPKKAQSDKSKNEKEDEII